jgi:hypothetical protein
MVFVFSPKHVLVLCVDMYNIFCVRGIFWIVSILWLPCWECIIQRNSLLTSSLFFFKESRREWQQRFKLRTNHAVGGQTRQQLSPSLSLNKNFYSPQQPKITDYTSLSKENILIYVYMLVSAFVNSVFDSTEQMLHTHSDTPAPNRRFL